MLTDVLEKLIGLPPDDYMWLIYVINLRFVMWILERGFILVEDIIAPRRR